MLLGFHAGIGGRAAKNFATFLHVAAVRHSCADLVVRDIPLSEVLGYIAAANGAQHHLTATLIDEAVALVEQTLSGNVQPSSGAQLSDESGEFGYTGAPVTSEASEVQWGTSWKMSSTSER